MANWEFFRQTVGETHWQQLQATDPEIPSGAYHLAIQGKHRPNQWIEVELYPPEQSANNRKKRFCQLDEQGFAIIIPHIELYPGQWQIQCRSDILAALMGDHWELNQYLQVTDNLPVEIELSQQESDLIPTQSQQGSEILPKTDQQDLEQLQSRLMNYADQILEELVSDLLSPDASSVEYNEQQFDSSESYQIELQQNYFIVETEQSIPVSGQVTSPNSSDAAQLSLQVILWNPETQKVVVQLFPQVLEPPFPATFNYVLTLPSNWSTSFLEGAVRLLGNAEQDSLTLAQQSFKVIAIQPTSQPLPIHASSDISQPVAPDQASTQFLTKQSSDQVLPPKLFTRTYQMKPKLPQLQQKTVSESTNTPNELASKPTSVTETVTKADANHQNHPLSQWDLIEEVVITKQQSEST